MEQVNAKYAARVQAAAEQLGLDVRQMQSELSALSELKDDAQRNERMEQMANKYNPLIDQVLAKANIDRAALRNEALKNVAVPPHARVLGSTGSKGQAAASGPGGKPDDANVYAIGWKSE